MRPASLDREGHVLDDGLAILRHSSRRLRRAATCGVLRLHADSVTHSDGALTRAASRWLPRPCSPPPTISTRMIPSPSAIPRSPLLVSRAMVVVITRVLCRILPPTMRTGADLSDCASETCQYGGQQVVCRPSHNSVAIFCHVPAPTERRYSSYSSWRSNTVCRVSAATMGKHQQTLGNDHGRRREEQPCDAKGARTRQQQVNHQSDHDRWQAHHRVHEYDDAASARESC